MVRPSPFNIGPAFALALLLACSTDKSDGIEHSKVTETAETHEAGEGGPWYSDADGDGYGDSEGGPIYANGALPGTVTSNTDCNDQDESVHPGAGELCNETDDDCDGAIDEHALDTSTWYLDADADEYGDDATASTACTAPDRAVANSGDCDDTEAAIHPESQEMCNERDDDCDGEVDEDALDQIACYPDGDSDGYGDETDPTWCCKLSDAWVDTSLADCDDENRARHPGAPEICNLADDDCDGGLDEDDDGDDTVNSLCELWAEHDLSEADVKVIGERTGLGSALVSFDANGDTYADLWLAEPKSDLAGTASGTLYLVEGPLLEGGFVSDRASATLTGVSLQAQAGRVVSPAMDVDADGYDDLWVAAPNEPTTAGEGVLYLVLSPVAGTLSLSEFDTRWLMEENCGLFNACDLSGEGDYDGDDIPDFLLGNSLVDSGPGTWSGKVWVSRVDDSWGERELSAAPLILTAETRYDAVGSAVAIVESTTGDGTDDLLVSGTGAMSVTFSGLVWVVDETPEDGTYVIDDLANARLVGEVPDDAAGSHLDSVGDINDDGYADYAVGADGESTSASGAGAIYVFYGPTAGRSSMAEADARMLGVEEMSNVSSVAGGGDVDGDGHLDFLCSGSNEAKGDLPGTSYLVRGPLDGGSLSLADADAIFDGEEAQDAAGAALSISGDTNQDGYADVIIGAPGHEEVEADERGAVYLIFGQP